MIREILATLDGSRTSESLLTHVEPIGATFDSGVTLTRVLSDNRTRWKAYACSSLETLAERMGADGGRVGVAALAGTPALAIAQFAVGEASGKSPYSR